ncbi:MAG: cell division protein SepF [Haloarculaceae archaeon]
MGFMNKLLGESGASRRTDDYVELDGVATPDVEADMAVHIARINEKQDVIDIKDAVYGGDIVIADITRHTTQDRTMEQITDELQQVARGVGGDIVQKDEDQIIITPRSVEISREKLGR